MSLSAAVIEKAFKKYTEYNLLVTGHSLGGGTAELVAMSFMYDHDFKSLLPRSTQVYCVVLAPPPVYRRSDGEHRYDDPRIDLTTRIK